MGDLFTELVVGRKPQVKDALIRAALIILTVAAFAGGLFFHPALFLAFFGLLAADYVIFPRLKVEYEYSYVNGQMDIAAVYSKKSRKNLASVELTEAECIAPLGSEHLQSFGNTYAVCDYSAKDPDNRPYVAVIGGTKPEKILLQLDQTMLKDLKYRIPRKVFDD